MIPTNFEVKSWIISTLQHSCHVEYFLEKLDVGKEDLERPHDLVGKGNKYEWDAIKGFALQYRTPKVDFEAYILPSLNLHRQQYHHKMFNQESINPSRDNLLLGAIDAVCSRLENRQYQGGKMDYFSLEKMLMKNENFGNNIMLDVIPLMKGLEQPKFESITSLINFPNIGLKNDVYKKIVNIVNVTLGMLKIKGYELD